MLAAALAVALLLSATPAEQLAAVHMGSCARAEVLAGVCSGNSNNVTIADIISNQPPSDRNVVDYWRDDDFDEHSNNSLQNCVVNSLDRYTCPALAKPGDPVPDSPGLPAITITDVASFAPSGTPLTAEPNGLGITGLPVNFVTGATTQNVAGSLFSIPVTVRFTPASFDLHAGDGTVTTMPTGGSTWEQLGQAQFTPTPTSHTYSERGTYDAHVEVHYTAEVDLGTGWIALAGTVTSVGPTQQIRIFEAHTALVAHTCAERADSPGC